MPLTESFVVALANPPSLTSSTAQQAHSKDATIYVHEFQPTSRVTSTWRNSKAASNCIAISESHIFAAQSGKSTVHVYSRARPGQNAETLVHFEEKIASIALACDETVLILGLEDGSLMLWDTLSGRQVNTGASHLHAVDVLAVDPADNFVLSGSSDSLILVWSLSQLLSFARNIGGFEDRSASLKRPKTTLSKHSGPITALALGYGHSTANIAVSAASDRSAIVWNYHAGVQLATYLLAHTALCLELDPADSGFFAGLDEGSVQRVDFYASQGQVDVFNRLYNYDRDRDIPRQPPSDSTWLRSATDVSNDTFQALDSDAVRATRTTAKAKQAEQSSPRNPEAILTLSLSYDTATLLTGHQNGRVTAWNVATRSIIRDIATYADAPVTNLYFLEPVGWSNRHRSARSIQVDKVTKPQPHQSWSGKDGGILGSGYTVSVKFPVGLPPLSNGDLYGAPSTVDLDSFNTLLDSVSLPESLLLDSLREFTVPEPIDNNSAAIMASIAPAPDFVPLDSADTTLTSTEIDMLRGRIERLEKSQRAATARAHRLSVENSALEEREERRVERKRRRMLEQRRSTDGVNSAPSKNKRMLESGQITSEDDGSSAGGDVGSDMMDE